MSDDVMTICAPGKRHYFRWREAASGELFLEESGRYFCAHCLVELSVREAEAYRLAVLREVEELEELEAAEAREAAEWERVKREET